jgi:cytochrome c oxidase assembly protein subunit 15
MYLQKRAIWFRRLAMAGTVLAAAVVILGAWVRLTDAGLGCPDWPGCYGHIYPNSGPEAEPAFRYAKALHEMIHRYAVASLGIVILVLAAWAIRFRKDPDQPLLPVILLFAVYCLQGALGALTVTLLLTPLIVTAHLLGGLTTLGLMSWLAMTPAPRQFTDREIALRKYALLGLAVLVMQVALGGWTSSNYAAVACPDFPTCQHSWWPPMDYRNAFVLWRGLGVDYEGGVLANPARVAIHFTHRLGALLAGSILIGLGSAAAMSARRAANREAFNRGPVNRRLTLAGGLLVFAVLLQISIGVATVHWGIPLALATMHNAGAAFLVISMVWLLRALWPGPAMVTLDDADPSR